tara:strand:- start:1640 stop:2545 length:906 start_codon:yes stop_codon:yes gene_type:complete
MLKRKKDTFICWVCDFSRNSGEGLLGRAFIKYFNKLNKCRTNVIKIKKNFLFQHKYISPFVGVVVLWYFFFKKKKIIYVNYLPFWNILLFLLLPPRTILGPITGGANFDNSDQKNYFVRKYIFPILYKLSEYLILLRFKNFIFSTDLLKKNLKEKTIEKSQFNFVLKIIKINNKNYVKKNNFLIYNRNHKNKKYQKLNNIIRKLISIGFKVETIGDKIKINGVKNYGYISHAKVLNLLKKTRYSLVSSENIFSLFTIDCINNKVKLLIYDKNYASVKFHKKYFIKYNMKFNFKRLLKKKPK